MTSRPPLNAPRPGYARSSNGSASRSIAVHLDYDDSKESPYFDLKILCNEEDLAGAPIAMRKRDG